MSQFIQIAIDPGGDSCASIMYVLDDEGTLWKRRLDNADRPFMEWHRSVTEHKPKPARKAKAPKQPFDEWFAELQANPTYAYINWPVELEKMKGWFKRNPDRRMTERFVMRWINKIEAPISLESLATKVCPNRVRKEGKSFMQVCGKPAEFECFGKRYCSDCSEELLRRGK